LIMSVLAEVISALSALVLRSLGFMSFKMLSEVVGGGI
jgi:uncharacterized membrane protein YuzA (DUF378 family)